MKRIHTARLIAHSMPVLLVAAIYSHAAWAKDAAPPVAAAGHTLRMCEIADCSVPQASEPYIWITKDGHVLNSGVTDEHGYATVSPAPGVSDYALESINLRWDMKVEPLCWSQTLEKCAKLVATTQHDGFDDPESVASRQKEKAQEETQEQQVKSDRVALYRKTALANDDELSWLAPLPPEWSQEEFQKRLRAVYKRIKGDLDHFGDPYEAALSFECKTPAQWGPTPDAAAVTTYIKSLPEGVPADKKKQAWNGLVEAGKQGNWQARQFIYFELNTEIKVRHNGNLALQWRWLQLLEWLQARQAGVLYGRYIDDVNATGMEGRGNDLDPGYIFAALHGSYSDTLKVGKALASATENIDIPRTDPDYKENLQKFHQLQAVAKRMRDCPHQMMPELFP